MEAYSFAIDKDNHRAVTVALGDFLEWWPKRPVVIVIVAARYKCRLEGNVYSTGEILGEISFDARLSNFVRHSFSKAVI